MPIARLTPDIGVEKKPAEPIVEKSTYKGIVSDHNETPVESLVAYLDGLPWTVDYYSQMLGEHSDLHELDTGQTPAMQQYTKLNKLELKVASDLQSSYDAQNAITTVSGSAIVIHVLPNVNDYFVSDAGSREQGLYRVKSVERKSFNRDSVYLIDYDLVAYVRDDETKWRDIESKVVRQYYFSKDRLVEGLSPVLREEEYIETFSFKKAYKELIRRYFKDFFNRGLMLLMVPQPDKRIYDPYVPIFISSVIDSQEAPEIREMKYVSMDHERYMAQGNIWTTLLERDLLDLRRVVSQMQLADRYSFNRSSWLHGAIYWDVDKYVYPKDIRDDRSITGLNELPRSVAAEAFTGEAPMEQSPMMDNNWYKHAEEDVALIKSVFKDEGYVVSLDFYQTLRPTSWLEVLIKDYLDCNTLNRHVLKLLLSAYPDWPAMERFYYGPILMLLTKEILKGYYK